MITGPAVLRCLARYQISTVNEATAQVDIARALRIDFVEGAVKREYRVSKRDRPDFMIGGRIALEVKVQRASKLDVWRQLCRYAEHDMVEEIVLATSLAMGLPPDINGKPVYYHSLGSNLL